MVWNPCVYPAINSLLVGMTRHPVTASLSLSSPSGLATAMELLLPLMESTVLSKEGRDGEGERETKGGNQ